MGRPRERHENAPLARGRTGPAWSLEWAAERAAEAMRYLAVNCLASGGSLELHSFQDETHAAAVVEDRGRYLETLRRYVRAGQRVERATRRRAA